MAYRMPAEWEPHAATWIAWPHHEPDWPGKLETIPWVYAEIVRALAPAELVHVLCQDAGVRDQARTAIAAQTAKDRSAALERRGDESRARATGTAAARAKNAK